MASISRRHKYRNWGCRERPWPKSRFLLQFDRRGRSISFKHYAKLAENFSYKRVRQTQAGDSWVSTVWLGVDHQFGWDGPKLIFETMVFDAPGGEIDFGARYMDRYSSERMAIKGHNRTVNAVRHGTLALYSDEVEEDD